MSTFVAPAFPPRGACEHAVHGQDLRGHRRARWRRSSARSTSSSSAPRRAAARATSTCRRKGWTASASSTRRTVAYLDLTGSGVETIAHLRDNGRITLLFCAFEGPPKIVRLYGRGESVLPGDADFADLAAQFPALPGRRSVIRVRLDRVSDSCGYAVPHYRYAGERRPARRLGRAQGCRRPRRPIAARSNARSIDGLPGIDDD